MKIPKTVKIGAHTYQIVNRDSEGESDARFGHVQTKHLKIYINDRFAQSQQEETFFHEVLHAICASVRAFPDTEQGTEDEEKLVQSLGHGFYMFLKDNNLLQ